ncbi:hypothetical protein FRB90_005560 [Tulasnella sp. 427]|nr:hypothetical protein FRB90_005560 [Tulasnella sp. 427]
MEGAATQSSSSAGSSVPKIAEAAKDKPPQRGPPPGEKKVLTKAERREIQEAQRAAKEAAKAQAAAGKPPPKGKQQAPAAPKKPQSAGGPSKSQSDANLAASHHHPKSTVAPSIETASTAPPPETLLRIFSHFALPKPLASLGTGIKGDIHPVIRKLGLQFADFRVVGANARCIAALTAFKTVIQDYQTPAGTTLSRHLMTYLSPQISYLTAARPMSMSTGNAIRYLKYEISILGPDLPEQDASEGLPLRTGGLVYPGANHLGGPGNPNGCYGEDPGWRHDFGLCKVRESFFCARRPFSSKLIRKLRSSVVEKAILAAWDAGRRFNVVVIDSRPLLEGKALLASLTSAAIPATYALLSSLPSLLPTVTTVILGAHALHANGSLYSRAGTAIVAMMAQSHKVPVIVCCETYKFSDTVLLDSFMKNEIAPSSAGLVDTDRSLQALSPLYDLTPHTNITAVVTEVGLIPATAVPTVVARSFQGSM